MWREAKNEVPRSRGPELRRKKRKEEERRDKKAKTSPNRDCNRFLHHSSVVLCLFFVLSLFLIWFMDPSDSSLLLYACSSPSLVCEFHHLFHLFYPPLCFFFFFYEILVYLVLQILMPFIMLPFEEGFWLFFLWERDVLSRNTSQRSTAIQLWILNWHSST